MFKIMILLTTHYNWNQGISLEDTLFAIRKNCEHPEINKIILFLEFREAIIRNWIAFDIHDNTIVRNIHPKFQELARDNEKIDIILISRRPTFKDYILYVNREFNKQLCIICNSDIYFPMFSKLERINAINMTDITLVLTRYDIYQELSEEAKNIPGIKIEHNGQIYKTFFKNGSTIDSWIFQTPFRYNVEHLDIEMGTFGCDFRLNYRLRKMMKVYNPCLSVISIHKHRNWSYDKYLKIRVKGKIYSIKEYLDFLKEQNDKYTRIKFCHVEKIPNK
jgi:hypothetical protein